MQRYLARFPAEPSLDVIDRDSGRLGSALLCSTVQALTYHTRDKSVRTHEDGTQTGESQMIGDIRGDKADFLLRQPSRSGRLRLRVELDV